VFPEELVARERIACYYDQRLGNTLTVPARVPNSTAAWAIYSVLLPDGVDRGEVQAALRADGVPTAIYYPRPLHRQPAYREHHDGATLPVSDHLADRILALPINPDMDEAAACQVCDALVAAVSVRR
jgi:dTDP-4-amino-4,6-dideoxygalactose transaminase